MVIIGFCSHINTTLSEHSRYIDPKILTHHGEHIVLNDSGEIKIASRWLRWSGDGKKLFFELEALHAFEWLWGQFNVSGAALSRDCFYFFQCLIENKEFTKKIREHQKTQIWFSLIFFGKFFIYLELFQFSKTSASSQKSSLTLQMLESFLNQRKW